MMDFIALLAPVLTQVAPPAAIPPPPPAPPMPAGALPESQRRRFISFVSGPVTCDGVAAAPTLLEQPMPSIGYAFWPADTHLPSIGLTFAIGVDGRPMDIRVNGDDRAKSSLVDSSDVVPAFATWRFVSGAPHRRCTVAFTVQDQPLTAASRDELTRHYAFLPGQAAYRREVFDRLRPVGATCYDPYFPPPLVQVFPDYRKVAQRPGTTSFAMMAFGIDRQGRPVDVRVATSDGNRDLDTKALAAMRRWRFVDGAAHGGCLYPYANRSTVPLKAPPPPDVAAYRPKDSDCEGHSDWASYPVLTYPEPFRRRSIEGWAVVRYDVAPWGELGNIEAVAAEPAAAFGTQAIEVMRTARKPATKHGLYGCVDLVKFVMGRPLRPGPRR
jgi:TonB family protein